MHHSVLIANRGEIACRIARTARRLGIRVIAVYSEADRNALHVRMADEAIGIGPAAVRDSYLNIEAVLDAARRSGADCLHPGYGFLSENAGFAEACANAGVVFVGPPPAAIRAMGLKDAAKRLMAAAGVPVVPGFEVADEADEVLAARAGELGFPVMIKAVAGGGGKGMRRVDERADFAAALQACRREAASSFGDDRVLVEKFIAGPRHIEIQVLSDQHGHCVHLFERDCSLQRRHQKVIEEAPAPGMTLELRTAMGAAAVAGAKSVGYTGVGTMEFIVDGSRALTANSFYFMEMNTRLQVEHPVTEAVTGLDLVEWQFRVAAGEALGFSQDDVRLNGHAVEARLYAEDPARGFLPQTGTLHRLIWPAVRDGLRIDTGVEQGAEITPHYDPMIAKIIVHGRDRAAAIAGLDAALRETAVLGLRSNAGFLQALTRQERFKAGQVSTALIGDHLDELAPAQLSAEIKARCAAAWGLPSPTETENDSWISPWAALGGAGRTNYIRITVDGEPLTLPVTNPAADPCHRDAETGQLYVSIDGRHFTLGPDDGLTRAPASATGTAILKAPMPGRILRLLKREGDEVSAGEPLIVLEAMKMEHSLSAGITGRLELLCGPEGSQVKEGDLLLRIA